MWMKLYEKRLYNSPFITAVAASTADFDSAMVDIVSQIKRST